MTDQLDQLRRLQACVRELETIEPGELLPFARRTLERGRRKVGQLRDRLINAGVRVPELA